MKERPGILFFSARRKLSIMYQEWIEKNGIDDSPFSVISFLTGHGLINTDKAYDYIESGGEERQNGES